MRPALQKSPISENCAFESKHLIAPYFDPNWHFHPEFQLFLVIKGTGTRFIGDHVSPFKEGDLLFTGPNLPHLRYFTSGPDLATHLAGWSKFGPDPRWKAMAADPQYKDNTSKNTPHFLAPTEYSQI